MSSSPGTGSMEEQRVLGYYFYLYAEMIPYNVSICFQEKDKKMGIDLIP